MGHTGLHTKQGGGVIWLNMGSLGNQIGQSCEKRSSHSHVTLVRVETLFYQTSSLGVCHKSCQALCWTWVAWDNIQKVALQAPWSVNHPINKPPWSINTPINPTLAGGAQCARPSWERLWEPWEWCHDTSIYWLFFKWSELAYAQGILMISQAVGIL